MGDGIVGVATGVTHGGTPFGQTCPGGQQSPEGVGVFVGVRVGVPGRAVGVFVRVDGGPGVGVVPSQAKMRGLNVPGATVNGTQPTFDTIQSGCPVIGLQAGQPLAGRGGGHVPSFHAGFRSRPTTSATLQR